MSFLKNFNPLSGIRGLDPLRPTNTESEDFRIWKEKRNFYLESSIRSWLDMYIESGGCLIVDSHTSSLKGKPIGYEIKIDNDGVNRLTASMLVGSQLLKVGDVICVCPMK